MKKGLILEGGAMRGMFTAGILDVMMENEIKGDGTIGVSAGAAFGCNYKSGQIGRTIRYNVRFARDKRYCSMASLIFTGNMYSKKFCYHTVPTKLDVFDLASFNANPMEFYAVATDVLTGKPVYKKLENCDESCFEWIRASASMPLAAKIVEIDGMKLLDGGVSDSIPIKFFENLGYEKNIIILTQPRNFIKKQNSMLSLMKAAFKKYPNMLNAIANRHIEYNKTLEYIRKREEEGSVLVLSPDEALPIKRVEHDPEKLKEVYKIGREAGEKNLERIKSFLNI